MQDGGPAYPCEIEVTTTYSTRTGFRRVPHPGMTLRQWYKGMALQGLLAGIQPDEEWADSINGPSKMAAEQADAMLAEDQEHKRFIEGQGEGHGREGDSHHAVVSGERPPLAGRADHAHG